jgi:hypothetical protein
MIATIVVVIALIGAGAYWFIQRGGTPGGLIKDSGENISDYTAVFLTNGQVYFGKMYNGTSSSIDLRDIYYLQVNQQIQPDQKDTKTTDASNPDIVLVKLGDELHGPNDRMLINRDQVIFTESLKKGSKVVNAIDENKKK